MLLVSCSMPPVALRAQNLELETESVVQPQAVAQSIDICQNFVLGRKGSSLVVGEHSQGDSRVEALPL